MSNVTFPINWPATDIACLIIGRWLWKVRLRTGFFFAVIIFDWVEVHEGLPISVLGLLVVGNEHSCLVALYLGRYILECGMKLNAPGALIHLKENSRVTVFSEFEDFGGTNSE